MRYSQLRILGQDFTVTYKKDMTDVMGLCSSANNTIDLKDGMQFEKEQEVLLHEVIHAISDLMESNLTEKQVSTLAVGVYAFLKDNDYSVPKQKRCQSKSQPAAPKPCGKQSKRLASNSTKRTKQ